MAPLREPKVKIQLFGSWAVWQAGQPIPPEAWRQEKTKALLKILASEVGRVFKRDELIEWLWPEADPPKAHSTLKSRIAELRRLLEPGLTRGQDSQFIETCSEGYRFKPEADCLIDLQEFVRHAKAGKAAEHAGHYEQAIASYEQALRWCEPGELLAETATRSGPAPFVKAGSKSFSMCSRAWRIAMPGSDTIAARWRTAEEA